MRKKFSTLKELDDFCDTSIVCVCGRLMSGLHMMGCNKLQKIRNKLNEDKKELDKEANS